MPESTIPVDLMNPGQVFACLGIVEAADTLLGNAAGVFDWNGPEVQFRVSSGGIEKPVERVMRFLEEAEVVARVPVQSANIDRWKWDVPLIPDPDFCAFPFPDPSSPATLPAVLCDKKGCEIPVEYWGDSSNRDNVKFWAGSGGYPGVALLRDAHELIRHRLHDCSCDPFDVSAVQTSSFRFDWRRDYIPIDAGFSPNKHGKNVSMIGFPLVEMLAAIGVSNARPKRIRKLEYQYGVLGGQILHDPVFLRAALGSTVSPVPSMPFRCFTMQLGWPGKENQARCITQVTEEIQSDRDLD